MNPNLISYTLTEAVGLRLTLLSALVFLLPNIYGVPVLRNFKSLGRASSLYLPDKDMLLKQLKTLNTHHLEWDVTNVLENAAGLASSCDMLDNDIYTYPWLKLGTPHVKSQLEFFTSGKGATGIFGFTRSETMLTPRKEWHDLEKVVKQWATTPVYAGEHRLITNAEKVGCTVTPACLKRGYYYTLLVCLFSPELELVPSSTEIELQDQPMDQPMDQQIPVMLRPVGLVGENQPLQKKVELEKKGLSDLHCPVTHFQDLSKEPHCKQCPPRKFSPEPNSKMCIKCPAKLSSQQHRLIGVCLNEKMIQLESKIETRNRAFESDVKKLEAFINDILKVIQTLHTKEFGSGGSSASTESNEADSDYYYD